MKKEKSNKEMFKELESLRQQVAEFGIMKRQYEWTEKRLRGEKERTQNYLDIARVVIVIIDKNGKVALINKKGAEILGYSQKEIIGKNWFSNFIPKGNRDEIKDIFLRSLLSGQKFVNRYENLVLTKKGEEHLISWHNTTLKDEEGKIIGSLSSGLDITERREIERKLKESEEKYHFIFLQATVAIILLDLKSGVVVDFNEAACISLGYTRKEFGKLNICDIDTKESFKNFKERVEKLKISNNDSFETKYKAKNGKLRDVIVNFKVINLGGKDCGHAIWRDITAIKEAKQNFKESEQRYRVLFNQGPDATLLLDPETGALVEYNERAYKNLGYTRKEFAKFRISDFEIAESPEDIKKHLKKIVDNGGDIFETKQKSKDGDVHNVLVSSRPVTIGEMTFVQSVWKDITIRKKAEHLLKEAVKALGESQKFNKSVLDSSPYPMIVIEADASVKYINPALEKVTGFSSKEVIGVKPPYPWWTKDTIPKTANDLKNAFKNGANFLKEIFQKKNGEKFYVEITSRELKGGKKDKRYVANWVDITQRKKTEEELSITKFVFDNMADAALWINSYGQIFYVNNAACKSLGYLHQELLTMKVFDIDNNFNPENWSQHWKVMKKNKIGKIETNFIDKEGKPFPVEIHGKYMEYDGQEYVCAIARDITERWRIERALRRSEEEKTRILDSLSEMVVYYGKDMRILWANKVAGDSRGLNPVELVGKRCYDVWHKHKEFCKNCPVVKVFKTGDYNEAEIILPDGRVWFIRAHSIKDLEGNVSGVVEVISDITIKKKIELEHRQSIDKSHRILEETVIALAATAERRDPYTAGHQRRVARLACAIAKEMNLDKDTVEGIRMASIIHDVGKVYVPAEILSKPSKLSELEFSIIKTHPQIGYDILKPVEFPWPIAMIVFQHHEKLDGSGYPRGIAGKDILLETKVLTVADVVEAMASYRPYRVALGIDKALAEIKQGRGILYDKQVVDACINLFKKKQFKLK